MFTNRSTPRLLQQQQPPRQSDPQQQQSGSNDFQPRAAGTIPEQQMGGPAPGHRQGHHRLAAERLPPAR